MKFFKFLLIASLGYFLNVANAQDRENWKYYEHIPLLIKPTNHDPNYIKTTDKSFYQLKNNWQSIIDSTWGPGLSLSDKLNIFDTYTSAISDEFDGFLSLGLDWTSWDSLRLHYRNQIDSSTSRGGFSALMNYLANSLRDKHTFIWDDSVRFKPLNPGVPLLVTSGFIQVQHFGAVVTVSGDTSILILRTTPNHPLGLQPGDIILGYESIPYRQIVTELMAAKLPLLIGGSGGGASSAEFDALLLGAGMNWHLFNTLDILQYSSGDTLTLSTTPMINLNIPPMLNNEQLVMQGIPFPDYLNGELVSYGIVNNTNIGYIYLYAEWPEGAADLQFFQAVNALQNTEGLIIDMRYNLGGWAFFDQAFDILFSESPLTLEDSYRCSPSTLDLCPSGNAPTFQVTGGPSSIYDYPIAVLLGPTCVSMGDLTAYRLDYHPMVKFFGKSSNATLGDNLIIDSFNDWLLRYSISDMFLVNQPIEYLNRREFPMDFPVWHNKDDAAGGIDAVVEAALSWMHRMIHAFNVEPHSFFVRHTIDTLTITANVANPNNHNIHAAAIINTLAGVFVDSLTLSDDGDHGDGLAGDGLYGCYLNPLSSEDVFTVGVSITDLDSAYYHLLSSATRFTTIGPVKFDHYTIIASDTIPNAGDRLPFTFTIRNDGQSSTASAVTGQIVCLDTFATLIPITIDFSDLSAGASATGSPHQFIRFTDDSDGQRVHFAINISSNRFKFWSDTFYVDIISGIDQVSEKLANIYGLRQNYPNPFNATTNIIYQLPVSSYIELTVYNLLGQKVETLVSEKQKAGNYDIQWNASDFPSGIYLCKMQTDRGVTITKKLVLLK